LNILIRDPAAFILLLIVSTVLSGLLIWAGARLTKGAEVPIPPSFLMGLGTSILVWVPIALSVSLGGGLLPGALIGLALTVPFLRLVLSLSAAGTLVVWVFNVFAQVLALTVIFGPTGERSIEALSNLGL
jgi:hypothetical protein